MAGIITATAVVAIVGILIGVALVYAGKKFHVDTDERETAIREVLPGNNCGACGYAGCDAVAAAIAKGEAPVNACPVGGQKVADAVGAIMGVSAQAAERKVAYVRCHGDCTHTSEKAHYVGIDDCNAAAAAGMNLWKCDFGCMGHGSCARVCPEHAITIEKGVAVVDREKCIGCGLCTKECPKKLITLVPYEQRVIVRCMNTNRGPAVKAACDIGCIGCRLCTRQCESGAIAVVDNLARINYSACTSCGKCAEKCPTKAIEMRA